MEVDYNYSLERLNKIVYNLLVNEQASKRRLIYALTNTFIQDADFPPHLQDDWRKIEKIILSKPKSEYYNTYYNSLINRTNKTCSRVINDIYYIKLKLEAYIKTIKS